MLGNGHLGCLNPNHLSWKTPTENREDQRIATKFGFFKRPAKARIVTEEEIEATPEKKVLETEMDKYHQACSTAQKREALFDAIQHLASFGGTGGYYVSVARVNEGKEPYMYCLAARHARCNDGRKGHGRMSECNTCKGAGLVWANASSLPRGFKIFAGSSLIRSADRQFAEIRCPHCDGSGKEPKSKDALK